jgi:hypothetical protein
MTRDKATSCRVALRLVNDSTGDDRIFVNVVAGANAVIAVSDGERNVGVATTPHQKNRRQQSSLFDFREVFGDVNVVRRKLGQIACAQQVLGLPMDDWGCAESANQIVGLVLGHDQAEVGGSSWIVVLVRDFFPVSFGGHSYCRRRSLRSQAGPIRRSAVKLLAWHLGGAVTARDVNNDRSNGDPDQRNNRRHEG